MVILQVILLQINFLVQILVPIQTEEAESTTPVEDGNSKSEENVSQNNNINTSKEGTNKI